MTDAKNILDRCREHGVDGDRLRRCLDGSDNWGKMVHAFEYLTVLGIVADAFKAEAEEQDGRPLSPPTG